MAASTAEQDFLTFATRYQAPLRGAAVLLVGDAVRADRLSSSVLARRLPVGGDPHRAWTAALRDLVRPSAALFDPPWARAGRVQLTDAAPPGPASALLDELHRLPYEPRAALVLGQFLLLTPAAAAEVLGTDVATVELWVGQAYAALAAGRPDRLRPRVLAEELRRAADRAGAAVPDPGAGVHLAHARTLGRRRRGRRALVAVASVVAVSVLATAAVRGLTAEEPAAAPPPPLPVATSTPTPTDRISPLCDIKEASCQATTMIAWRQAMADVVSEHLDPGHTYFTGYKFSYDDRYEDPDVWRGRGGALGLEVYRLTGGATEIYLQVASSYADATRCGTITGNRCQGIRFMDGNRFTFTASSSLEQGIEVQHRPDGDQVVTVVARSRGTAKLLDVSRGDLIELVQDRRLRLPVI